MIFSATQYDINYGCPVPLKEVLQTAALQRSQQPAGPRPRAYYPDKNAPGRRAQRTLHDRNGDPYPVFRELSVGGLHPKHATPRYLPSEMLALTAQKGVGRPPGTPMKACRRIDAWYPTMAERRSLRLDETVGGLTLAKLYRGAVILYGSQRKAAAALGVSLGKLQRELRKAPA